MRDAFIARLTEIARRDKRIVLITGDLGFGVLTKFAEEFPDQFINAGVAEQNMTAIACGMAMEGRIAFTYSIANFTTLRCLEQLRNDVAYHNAHVVAVSVGGGFSYGQLGMSHFATEDLAILRAIPNMRVISPCDVWEAAQAAESLVNIPGPAYLRLDKDKAGTADPGGRFELTATRVVKDGGDVTLIATGAILKEAIKASDLLSARGVSARVIAVRSVKPLDPTDILDAARSTPVVVTLEEHMTGGGLGGAVAELLLEAGAAPRRFRRLGIPDEFPTIVGDQDYLRAHYRLDGAAVAERVAELLS